MKSGSYCKTITLICGGVGGAKLARGFARAFPEHRINIITNTADDTEFYGLHVSPDLDTMMYTLAGLSGTGRGWGLKDDSFQCLSQLEQYGEATWFKLGDKDFATHILRTKMLYEGKTLTQVISYLSRKLGISVNILPMTDQRIETFIKTGNRTIPFQEYFVLRQQNVDIKQVIFKGMKKARITKEVANAISGADLLIFAPSNPIVSILPILGIPGMRRLIVASPALKVAVSPFKGKKAISGPAKELMEAKGFEGSSRGVARFYTGLIDVLFIHHLDAEETESIKRTGIAVATVETIMKDVDASVKLAQKIYDTFSAWKGQVL